MVLGITFSPKESRRRPSTQTGEEDWDQKSPQGHGGFVCPCSVLSWRNHYCGQKVVLYIFFAEF